MRDVYHDQLDTVEGDLRRMAELAAAALARATWAVLEADLSVAEAVARLAVTDDAVDSLHRTVLQELLAARGTFTMEAAIDATLISRYYERYADHAVNAAEDLIFLVTGRSGRRPLASFPTPGCLAAPVSGVQLSGPLRSPGAGPAESGSPPR